MKKQTFIDGDKTILDTDYYLKLLSLEKENDFLRKRENKLQMIEQMFKSGSVDLSDLVALVEEKWNKKN